MKRWRTFQLLGGMALVVLLTVLRLADPSLIRDARLAVFDTYQRLSPRPYQPVPVRVIDIDDASLARFGQWPWPRTLIAQLVERLGEMNAASIAFDMIFAEPDRLTIASDVLQQAGWIAPAKGIDKTVIDHDAVLAETIARYPVVGGFALRAISDGNAPAVKTGFASVGGDPKQFLANLRGSLNNIPVLENAFSGNGSLSVIRDRDAIVRRIPLIQLMGEQLLPGLTLEALRTAQGVDTIVIRSDSGQEKSLGLERVRVGAVEIPVTHNGQLWLHHTRHQPERAIPAWQILDAESHKELAARVTGHIALIGISATALGDRVPTPLNPVLPGVFVHAAALEQMLLGWFLHRPNWADGAEILSLILLGLFLVLLMPYLGPIWCALIAGVVIVAAAGGSWLAFTNYRLLLDPVYPAVASILIYLLVSFTTFLRSEMEKSHIRRAFSRYLAPDLLLQLEKNPSLLRIGGETRRMSFLFSDIAGFTSLTERTPPHRMVAMLNKYLDGCIQIIIDHGGNINKIIGDAVFAIFSAPLDQPDHAERAVRCALALDRFTRQFSADCRQKGIPFGLTRIGVNTGTAIVGNFGGQSRFDFTAIGDSVNVSSRLEEANRALSTTICIAGSTVEHCPQIDFRPVGKLLLRGRSAPIEGYQPLSRENDQLAPLAEYNAAYELMAQQAPDAAARFKHLAERYPDDALVNFHSRRLDTPGQNEVFRVS